MSNVTVVIPTIREECALRWVKEWRDDLAGTRIILVEDNPAPTFSTPGIEHYSWRDFTFDMGPDAWIIPRRTSACRSYGFLKALESDTDIIWTLDDDCYPEEQHKGQYLDSLKKVLSGSVRENAWWNTIDGTGLYPRGYPYDKVRESSNLVMLHHGLWSNVPDLDGITQLANLGYRLPPCETREIVPFGKLFPMCIMNVAFCQEMTPLMYMLLMGQDHEGIPWGYDRFDDIWGGVLMKLAADHLGYAVSSGAPGVRHSRASDPRKNAELEADGMKAHEDLWQYLRDVKLTGSSPGECYLELAKALDRLQEKAPRAGYWHSLSAAMRIWVEQCEKRGVRHTDVRAPEQKNPSR